MLQHACVRIYVVFHLPQTRNTQPKLDENNNNNNSSINSMMLHEIHFLPLNAKCVAKFYINFISILDIYIHIRETSIFYTLLVLSRLGCNGATDASDYLTISWIISGYLLFLSCAYKCVVLHLHSIRCMLLNWLVNSLADTTVWRLLMMFISQSTVHWMTRCFTFCMGWPYSEERKWWPFTEFLSIIPLLFKCNSLPFQLTNYISS